MGNRCCNFTKQEIIINYHGSGQTKKIMNYNAKALKAQSPIQLRQLGASVLVEEKEQCLFINNDKQIFEVDSTIQHNIQANVKQDSGEKSYIVHSKFNMLPSCSSNEETNNKLISRIKHISLYKAKSKCSINGGGNIKQVNTNTKLAVSHLSFNNNSTNNDNASAKHILITPLKVKVCDNKSGKTSRTQNELLKLVNKSSWMIILDYLDWNDLRTSAITCVSLSKLANSPSILLKFYLREKPDLIINTDNMKEDCNIDICNFIKERAAMQKIQYCQIDVICEEDYFKTEASVRNSDSKSKQEPAFDIAKSMQTKKSNSEAAASSKFLVFSKKINDLEDKFSGSISEMSCEPSHNFNSPPNVNRSQVTHSSIYTQTALPNLASKTNSKRFVNIVLSKNVATDRIKTCFE